MRRKPQKDDIYLPIIILLYYFNTLILTVKKMDHPRFSIITVTYNAGKVLEPTIRSIIEQDYDNIEFIIVDGASTDNTIDIINNYKKEISKVISEKDSGLYDAMNKGLDAATGDYVWFINAGDAIHSPYTLRKIVQRIEAMQMLPDVIYGETAIIDDMRTVVGMRRLKTPDELDFRSFKFGMVVCHQSFIARREIAPKYNLGYRFSSDFDWCLNILKQSNKNFNTRLILSDYLQDGLSIAHRKESLKERFSIMRKNFGTLSVLFFHIWFLIRFGWAKFLNKE